MRTYSLSVLMMSGSVLDARIVARSEHEAVALASETARMFGPVARIDVVE